jgi:cytochrome b
MEQTVKVWDPYVRLFHWGLVISFAIAWFSAEKWDDLHEWAGWAAAALIGFRLLWGLGGPRYARFTQFIRSPRDVVKYTRASMQGDEPRYLGHNPAGAVMIVGLILAMGGTALTGWMLTLWSLRDYKWRIEPTHQFLSDLILVMVAIHVVGVIYGSLRHKENLVRAMFNGRKRAPEDADIV